jgi:hypothetical protein
MPDRLPPPPFWRTRYSAEKVINKPGRQIDPAEIRQLWRHRRGA